MAQRISRAKATVKQSGTPFSLPDAAERAATVAFVPHSIQPRQLSERLAERGFMIGSGGFYAVRLLQAMRVDPASGVARISFVHYTTAAEIDGLIDALHASLRD